MTKHAREARAEGRQMTLAPFVDVTMAANALIGHGVKVRQQFRCAACGAKQTIDTPNVFYTSGRCEECESITNIVKDGTNMMLEASTPEAVRAVELYIAGNQKR